MTLVIGALLSMVCRASTSATTPLPASSLNGFIDSVDARLGYRFDLPTRTGPIGAVVFGHGSGRMTRESCRLLATGFLARGFAALCFDKRGVGESTGEYSGVGTRNSVRIFLLVGPTVSVGEGVS